MLTLILYINFCWYLFWGLLWVNKEIQQLILWLRNKNQATMKNYHFNLLDGFTTVIIFILNGGLVCRVFFNVAWERLEKITALLKI